MEQRRSPRQAFPVPVLIDSHAGGAVAGRICDINLEGLFVECDRLPVAENAPVFLRFTVQTDEFTCGFDLQGRVVHRSATGAGIAFGELDAEHARQLRDILYPRPEPAH